MKGISTNILVGVIPIVVVILNKSHFILNNDKTLRFGLGYLQQSRLSEFLVASATSRGTMKSLGSLMKVFFLDILIIARDIYVITRIPRILWIVLMSKWMNMLNLKLINE